MSTLEQQLAWETKHRDNGRTKVLESLRKAEEQGRVTDTPLGTGVLRRYVLSMSERLSKDITEDIGKPGRSKAHSPLLRDLDPDSVALIAISTVMNMLADENKKLSTVAMGIGKTVYGELALNYFRDMNEELYETLVNDLTRKMSKDLRHRMTVMRMQAEKAGISIPEWTPGQKLQVGLYLLSLMDGEDGIVEQYTDFSSGKTTYFLQYRPAITKLMNSAEAHVLAHAGFAAPCLIKPLPWKEDGSGGFHGDLKVRAPRFFKGSAQQLEIMKSEGCDLTIPLKMLDVHQSVAWKVNPFILNVVKEMRKHGYETKDVQFTTAHPEPARPQFLDLVKEEEWTEVQQLEFNAWKRARRDWHTTIRGVSRAESKLSRVIYSAHEMLDYDEFYLVYQMCDRSRMYSVSGPLSPQGSDVQKAMIHAAHGKPITNDKAYYWFRLGIASKYGIDKLAMDDCVKWVDDNHDNIMACGRDPMNRDAFYWWSDADKPLQFLAFCDEYYRYHTDRANFVNRLAVAMDGTCNGLQNYSALLRDEVGGASTNLTGKWGDKPNDIYGDVAVAAWKRLANMPVSVMRTEWIKAEFNRSLTKTSVMTQVYGSTFGTCRKSIVAYCTEKGLFSDADRWELADYASRLVWDGIGDVVVRAKLAMDWLQKVAGSVLRHNEEYITWLTPSGWRVVQIYNKSEVKRVQAAVGHKITLRLREETDKPDKIRHRNSLPPNFIHGIDASHMAFVSVSMGDKLGYTEGPIFLHMIHDDFGTLAADAELLYNVIRIEFVSMHESYDLSQVFSTRYPYAPKAPGKGNLDIRSVLTSPNFFR